MPERISDACFQKLLAGLDVAEGGSLLIMDIDRPPPPPTPEAVDDGSGQTPLPPGEGRSSTSETNTALFLEPFLAISFLMAFLMGRKFF